MYILINLERHKAIMGDIVSNLVSTYGVPLSIVDSIEKLCPHCASFSEQIRDSGSSQDLPNYASESPFLLHPSPPPCPPALRSVEKFEECEPSTSANGGSTASGNRVIESAIAQVLHSTPNIQRISSEDGGSTSSIVDEDEDTNLTFNPELLATFISSTPTIFSSPTHVGMSKSRRDSLKRELPRNHEVNGKVRRGRIVYTSKELDILEQYYNDDANACADPVKRRQLCTMLDIDYHRLKVWFQNRRRKDKIRSLTDDQESANDGF